MCWFVPLIIAGAGMVMQMQAAEEEANAASYAANYNAAELERQAKIQDSQAVDAFERGETDRLRYMRGFEQEQGSRAAAFGASGVEVGSGSALDILADSAASAALDAATIRSNAGKEAADFREQARSSRASAYLMRKSGADAVTAGQMKKKTAVLNAAGSMAGSFSGGFATKPAAANTGRYWDPALSQKVSSPVRH